MPHIHKDDIVAVITGDDAPTTGRVLQVLPGANKVLVEGVNRVYKHLKPNRRNAQGGRLSKEMPIAISNVLLFCPNCKRGVRISLMRTLIVQFLPKPSYRTQISPGRNCDGPI